MPPRDASEGSVWLRRKLPFLLSLVLLQQYRSFSVPSSADSATLQKKEWPDKGQRRMLIHSSARRASIRWQGWASGKGGLGSDLIGITESRRERGYPLRAR